MKRSLAIAMQVALLIGPSIAQEDLGAAARAAFCSTIEDSVARLACFDKAFPRGEFAAAQPSPAAPASTAWSVEVGKAPDDSPTVIAILAPTEANGAGIGTGSLSLILRCTNNTTSVSLSTDLPMTDDAIPVTMRIGEAPASTVTWSRSATDTSIGLWRGAAAIPFIRSLPDNEQLVVTIEEPGRLDAQFDLGNVGDIATQVAEACQWSLAPPKPGNAKNAPMELGIQ